MRKYAIIVAGGVGSRSGDMLPKQFHKLLGRPMLWWSLRAFHAEDSATRIMVVMHPDYITMWRDMFESLPPEERIDHEICSGGASRAASVSNGLSALGVEDESLVAVHDAARPLIEAPMISSAWRAASDNGCAVPAIAVSDSLRHLDGRGGSEAVSRSEYVAVQTPQTFRGDLLKRAYEQPLRPDFTDDASVAEAAGMKVALFEGSPVNMKVTNPDDFAVAELLLGNRFK